MMVERAQVFPARWIVEALVPRACRQAVGTTALERKGFKKILLWKSGAISLHSTYSCCVPAYRPLPSLAFLDSLSLDYVTPKVAPRPIMKLRVREIKGKPSTPWMVAVPKILTQNQARAEVFPQSRQLAKRPQLHQPGLQLGLCESGLAREFCRERKAGTRAVRLAVPDGAL